MLHYGYLLGTVHTQYNMKYYRVPGIVRRRYGLRTTYVRIQARRIPRRKWNG
jgi:hypothetical protein